MFRAVAGAVDQSWLVDSSDARFRFEKPDEAITTRSRRTAAVFRWYPQRVPLLLSDQQNHWWKNRIGTRKGYRFDYPATC